MVTDKTLDEPVTMVIAGVPAQGQQNAVGAAGGLQPFGLQLAFEEAATNQLIVRHLAQMTCARAYAIAATQ